MCKKNGYTLMHCHSPIGSVVARIAACNARKKGMKVIYTAHGFHFYKGAPKKNWLVFYPIEKMCSKLTDVLITINQEDYIFAKKHMKAKKIEYIPGVGIDIKKFNNGEFDRAAKRKELGLDADDIMLLSVGELNQNKNHEVIIKAIGALENQNIHYFIAGKGDKEELLKKLAEQKNVKLHLLGRRRVLISRSVFARTPLNNAGSGDSPPITRPEQSSIRFAPPFCAATADATLSVQISKVYFITFPSFCFYIFSFSCFHCFIHILHQFPFLFPPRSFLFLPII